MWGDRPQLGSEALLFRGTCNRLVGGGAGRGGGKVWFRAALRRPFPPHPAWCIYAASRPPLLRHTAHCKLSQLMEAMLAGSMHE